MSALDKYMRKTARQLDQNGKNANTLQTEIVTILKDQYQNLDEETILTQTKKVLADPTLKTYLNMLKTEEKKKQAFLSLVRVELEKIAALEQIDMFVVGRYSKRSRSNEWAISTLLALVPDIQKKGAMKLVEINLFEKAGEHEQLYQKLQHAIPLHYYRPHVARDQNGRIFLQSTTEFINGKTLAEINEEKYGALNDDELLETFLNLKVYDSIGQAGLSETNEQGFALNTSLRAVRLLVQNIRKTTEHEAFPSLYNYYGNAVDFDGQGQISVNFGGYKDLSYLESMPNAMGIAIGTVTFREETHTFFFNVFAWIPIEE